MMIYETAYIVRPDATEADLASLKNIVSETVTAAGGTILVNDDWGMRVFAQPLRCGTRGHYFYSMYKGPNTVNLEIERRFRINESIMRFLVIKLGEESQEAELVKAYKNPNHMNVQDDDRDIEKDRKMSSKKRSCWFSANKTSPDWKNPSSYAWLVNEFGKISPARVTSLRPGFQRKANAAIKRGRCMGLISHLAGDTFERV
jgi:small subunit ribosomal protein S6